MAGCCSQLQAIESQLDKLAMIFNHIALLRQIPSDGADPVPNGNWLVPKEVVLLLR
jgi:hypothetical protein